MIVMKHPTFLATAALLLGIRVRFSRWPDTLAQLTAACVLVVVCACSSDTTDDAEVGGAKAQAGSSGGGTKATGTANTVAGGRSASAGTTAVAGGAYNAGATSMAFAGVAGTPALGTGASAGMIGAGGVLGAGGGTSLPVAGTAGSLLQSEAGTAGVSGAPTTSKTICQPVDELRCGPNNARERCDIGGDWVPAAQPCTGAAPVCTGNGICAAYRLIQGGLEPMSGSVPAPNASYVLLHQTLLESPRTCNASYCVTGGIAP